MMDSAKSASTILRVEGLIKIYGTRRVVDGVSFDVNKGEIVGLLGPNGAGKTTSFRMACGLINTNGGTVYLGNQDVTDWPMYRRSRDGGMGYLPQDKSVFQKLSVQNNLYGVMEMIGMKKAERKQRCEDLLEKFNLTHLRQSYGGSLSGGERRRLEIARSLVSDPKIILLDEPFAAIDPVTVASIQEIIRKLASEGIAILITDHSVQDTLEITKRSYVIQSGKVLCEGTPAEVLGNSKAREVYFGDKQERFQSGAPSKHSESNASHPHVHKKHSHHAPPQRPIDPEWEVPKSEIITEKGPKHEAMDNKSQPFHLRFHTPSPVAAPPEVMTIPPKPAGEESGIRSRRLRPISSSITPDIPPNSEELPPQEESGMSSIIRNLGNLIWKDK
jgi:lipopolysaccharide export system ATP-binding protein